MEKRKEKKRKSQHKTNMDGEHKENKKNENKMLYKNEWNGYTFFFRVGILSTMLYI
jgi:hypothetical protein